MALVRDASAAELLPQLFSQFRPGMTALVVRRTETQRGAARLSVVIVGLRSTDNKEAVVSQDSPPPQVYCVLMPAVLMTSVQRAPSLLTKSV